MNMENLILRIFIQHIQGAEIAYLYNRESFDLLQINKHQYDGSQFIEAGQALQYGHNRYIIDSVNFKMYSEMQEMNPIYGINMYAPTEPTDFNCQVRVFVRNL